MNHSNHIYRTSHYKGRSKLSYVISYRSFSSSCRSDVTVVGEGQKGTGLTATEQRLLVGPTICKVRQMYIKKETSAGT